MLHLLGVRLHPAIGVLAGAALVAFGVVSAAPVLCFVGVVVVLATVWTRIGARRDHDPSLDDEDASAERGANGPPS
jgi:hypothetical protein